jgi:SAM-dependent methyltransferase
MIDTEDLEFVGNVLHLQNNASVDLSLLKNILSTMRDNPELAHDIKDSFGRNQFAAKSLLVDLIDQMECLDSESEVVIFGCWYGSVIIPKLAKRVKSIYGIDLDKQVIHIAKNKFWKDNSKIKLIEGDAFASFRKNYGTAKLFINTSCEHMPAMKDWPSWSKVSDDAYFAFQSNNMFGIQGHINCVDTIEDFKKQLPAHAEVLHQEELTDDRGTRFTLVGKIWSNQAIQERDLPKLQKAAEIEARRLKKEAEIEARRLKKEAEIERRVAKAAEEEARRLKKEAEIEAKRIAEEEARRLRREAEIEARRLKKEAEIEAKRQIKLQEEEARRLKKEAEIEARRLKKEAEIEVRRQIKLEEELKQQQKRKLEEELRQQKKLLEQQKIKKKETTMTNDIKKNGVLDQSQTKMLEFINSLSILDDKSEIVVFGCKHTVELMTTLAEGKKRVSGFDSDDSLVRSLKHNVLEQYSNIEIIDADVITKNAKRFEDADLTINTICEHMPPMNEWESWKRFKTGSHVVFQSNNSSNKDGLTNCVTSLDEFKTQLPLNVEVMFEDESEHEKGTRYTIIGKITA